MGILNFLAKKDYVCTKCGRTFQARLEPSHHLCTDCMIRDLEEREKWLDRVEGYVEYSSAIFAPELLSADCRKIAERKEEFKKRFKLKKGITDAELIRAGVEYKNMSDDEIADVLKRAYKSRYSRTIGAAYTPDCFLLSDYRGVVVDVNDVFAVGYTSNYQISGGTGETILCAVFTNDPYVPVFPMLFYGETKMFELFKSKSGRAAVTDLFTQMCPNLSYPVCDLDDLEKTLKAENVVRGNIGLKEMDDFISSAKLGSGVFNMKKREDFLYPESEEFLKNLGYCDEYEMKQHLGMDKMFRRKFWEKHIERLGLS